MTEREARMTEREARMTEERARRPLVDYATDTMMGEGEGVGGGRLRGAGAISPP